jgi:hypothetical protein
MRRLAVVGYQYPRFFSFFFHLRHDGKCMYASAAMPDGKTLCMLIKQRH